MLLGNSDSQFGVCLTGDFSCNGTCSIDPKKYLPFKMDYWSNETIGCIDKCENAPKVVWPHLWSTV